MSESELLFRPGTVIQCKRPMLAFYPEGHPRRTTERGPLTPRFTDLRYVGPYPGRPGMHVAERHDGDMRWEVPFQPSDLVRPPARLPKDSRTGRSSGGSPSPGSGRPFSEPGSAPSQGSSSVIPRTPPSYEPTGEPAGWFPLILERPTRRWRTEWFWWDGESWDDKPVKGTYGLPRGTRRANCMDWAKPRASLHRLLASGEPFSTADVTARGIQENLHFCHYWGLIELMEDGRWKRAQQAPPWLTTRLDPFAKAQRSAHREEKVVGAIVWLIGAGIVLALVAGAFSFLRDLAQPSYDINCSEFRTHADAQYELEWRPSDPHGLDRDGNGIACEHLP